MGVRQQRNYTGIWGFSQDEIEADLACMCLEIKLLWACGSLSYMTLYGQFFAIKSASA
jgi:hypothetical protein